MQKYYIRDFLTKELEKNDGKLTQYYVENDHEAIIEREIWDAAQLVSQRENLLSGWEKDIAQGNALERLRAAQMKELKAEDDTVMASLNRLIEMVGR